jgi:hypothetical protein
MKKPQRKPDLGRSEAQPSKLVFQINSYYHIRQAKDGDLDANQKPATASAGL